MTTNDIDIVLIGQGLAGSILAYQLHLSGKSVMVLDNHFKRSSSKVAAGIINPITGPRLTLTDNFEKYFQIAKKFYQDFETKFDINLWNDLAQQRIIKKEQRDYLEKRRKDPKYQAYLGEQIESDILKSSEVININRSAMIDCKQLISSTRSWLENRDCHKSIKVDYAAINNTGNGIEIAGFRAKKIIFCEGYQAINNPWLSDLPFLLSKGEILTVDTDQKTNALLNWGSWLAPIDGKYKLGSNYEWNNLDLNRTDSVKNDLVKSLTANTNLTAEVINHEVGIRPTTRQRKPFIGPLNNLENAYCFNGFGSKGCLLIPYYAELLTNAITGKINLDQELTQWL